MKRIRLLLPLIILFIASIYSLRAQQADAEIVNSINTQDYFTLNKQYPLLKDSVSPLLSALSETMIATVFNKTEKADLLYENLIATYQGELSTERQAHLSASWARILIDRNQYKKAADLLSNFINRVQASDSLLLSLPMLQYLQTELRTAKSLYNIPAGRVVRPDSDTEVPLTIKKAGDGELMYIPVTINGNENLFILDTGAGVPCSVSEEFALKNNIRIICDSLYAMGSTSAIDTKLGIIDSLSVGDIVYYNVRTVVTNEGGGATPEYMNFVNEGILGRQFLQALGEVKIRPKEKKILFPAKFKEEKVFKLSKVLVAPLRPTSNMMLNNDGQLYVEVFSGDKRLIFNLDTGSTDFYLSSHYFQKYKGEVRAVGIHESVGIAGFGGARIISTLSLPIMSLQIGDTEMETRKIPVHTQGGSDYFGDDGTIGYSLIRQFSEITLDFEQMTIDIEQ